MYFILLSALAEGTAIERFAKSEEGYSADYLLCSGIVYHRKERANSA
jgi:hypothetical protein